MVVCSRRELEVKWAAERDALRHECHVELRHKLLEVAQAQRDALSEKRETLHEALGDEILLDLKQKLDAIALSGRQLSQVFMNSLMATFAHRIAAAAIQSKKKPKQSLVAEEAIATWNYNADFHPTSGCNLVDIASNSASGTIPQALDCLPTTSSRYPPHFHMASAEKYECTPAKVSGGAGLTLEGFLVDHVLKQPLQDDKPRGAQTQLARLVQERVELDRQISEERNLLAKRYAYLRECRVAAEREKEMAQKELSAAMLSLVMAEKERVVAANCRAAALDELKHVSRLREHSQPEGICREGLRVRDAETPQKTSGYNEPGARSEALQREYCTSPQLSQRPPTCPAIATFTPSGHPEDTVFNGHSGESCSVPAATSSDSPIWPKVATEVGGTGDRQSSSVMSHSAGVKADVVTVTGTLENPIGPYVRPPMALEDMLKCIRCLFGKDKSLKTGNRARAFLGIPWSEIVSFDPDVLLGRGVLGIKEGSTGMASRLRMMTIIESALANQNNDTIPAEVWERPTHFCENCQKRYPISVSSNEVVLPFEESVQNEIGATTSQPSVEGNSRSQEASGTVDLKSKRNRKRPRRTRVTRPPR